MIHLHLFIYTRGSVPWEFRSTRVIYQTTTT